MRPVADTSFLVAVVDALDPHHAQAVRLLRSANPPAVGREALAELQHVAQFRERKAGGGAAGLRAARAVLGSVLDDLGCPLEQEMDLAAVRATFAAHPKLSWVDAAVLVQARGRELWTFDSHQQALHSGVKGAKGS